MKLFLIAFVVILALPSCAGAQTSADIGSDTPKETEQLAFKVGNWKIKARIKNSPTSYLSGNGTMKVFFDEDGKTLLADLNVKFPNFEVNGTTKRVFNPDHERWDITWNPATGPVIEIEGQMKDDRFIEINYGKDQRGPYLGRLVIFNMSDDHFSVRKDRLYDDGTVRQEIWAYEAARIKDKNPNSDR